MEKFAVKTGSLRAMGFFLAIFGIWIISLGVIGKSPVTAVLGAVIFLFSFLPLFTSGTITVEGDKVSVKTFIGTFGLPYTQVAKVLAGSGNVVLLRSDGGRVALPAPSYWSGKQKAEAIKLLFLKLNEKGLPLQNDFRASLMLSRGTRIG